MSRVRARNALKVSCFGIASGTVLIPRPSRSCSTLHRASASHLRRATCRLCQRCCDQHKRVEGTPAPFASAREVNIPWERQGSCHTKGIVRQLHVVYIKIIVYNMFKDTLSCVVDRRAWLAHSGLPRRPYRSRRHLVLEKVKHFPLKQSKPVRRVGCMTQAGT